MIWKAAETVWTRQVFERRFLPLSCTLYSSSKSFLHLTFDILAAFSSCSRDIADCTRSLEITCSQVGAKLSLSADYIRSQLVDCWLQSSHCQPTPDTCGRCRDIRDMMKASAEARGVDIDEDWVKHNQPEDHSNSDLPSRPLPRHHRHQPEDNSPLPEVQPSDEKKTAKKRLLCMGWPPMASYQARRSIGYLLQCLEILSMGSSYACLFFNICSPQRCRILHLRLHPGWVQDMGNSSHQGPG